MEYRTLGKTGYRVSRLGFGSMRLPTTTIGGKAYIDLDRAVEVMHAAFRLGVSYVDCGFLYGNEQAEIAVGRALRSWPARDQIVVTNKCSKFRMEKPGDLRRMLEHQLQRMELDWLHIYCFHGIGWDNFYEMDAKTGWIADMMKAYGEGLFKHIGFSFHDEPAGMLDLISLGWAEMVTCQYNYLDRRNDAVMAEAKRRGMGMVVMGPVGGGRLSVKPKGIEQVAGLGDLTPTELALRFVVSNPSVDVAISGMGSVEMVQQNVASVERGPLDAGELAAVNELMDRYGELSRLYCTGCEYCMPCPHGVNIPRCFELYNYRVVYGLEKYALDEYARLRGEKKDAAACEECEICLEKCPQQIPITTRLKEVRAALEQ